MPMEQSSFFGGFFGRDKGFGAHEFADVLAPDYLMNTNFNALPELYTGINQQSIHESPMSSTSDKPSEVLGSPKHQPAAVNFV